MKNLIIGGIPAKILKTNVEWRRDSVNQSLDNGLTEA